VQHNFAFCKVEFLRKKVAKTTKPRNFFARKDKMKAMLRDLRCKLGRWLLKPEFQAYSERKREEHQRLMKRLRERGIIND